MNFADLSLVLPFADARARAERRRRRSRLGSGEPRDDEARRPGGRVRAPSRWTARSSAFQPKVFTDLDGGLPQRPDVHALAVQRHVRGPADRGRHHGPRPRVQDRPQRARRREQGRAAKLKLGERVESPGAMRLPLDLAIAILSDSRRTHRHRPAGARQRRRPEFSYGHVIWQALVTVITKVATAPFRALGALFGGGGERAWRPQSPSSPAATSCCPPSARS